MYQACYYKSKPAIFDTVTRIYYFGYKSMKQARTRAKELNTLCSKDVKRAPNYDIE